MRRSICRSFGSRTKTGPPAALQALGSAAGPRGGGGRAEPCGARVALLCRGSQTTRSMSPPRSCNSFVQDLVNDFL